FGSRSFSSPRRGSRGCATRGRRGAKEAAGRSGLPPRSAPALRTHPRTEAVGATTHVHKQAPAASTAMGELSVRWPRYRADEYGARDNAGGPGNQRGGSSNLCAAMDASTRLNSSHVKISYAVFCLK